jgi:hypothetical protein
VLTEVDLATRTPPEVDLTTLLVERGADVHARDNEGKTAADLVQGQHPLAEALLRERMRKEP